jgi:hypothetical protein
VILSILALLATLTVAYMSAVQGVYRAAQTLVACILAGVVAFGVFGPLAGLLSSDNAQGVWYYVADAFCLWAVFCVVFLALRTAAENLLPNQPKFPAVLDWSGGAVLGAAAGYLTVGVCLVFVQMLPTAPDFLGYEAFRYVARKGDQPDDVLVTNQPLWLRWDHGALNFFGYLSGAALGSDETDLFMRCGDVYPPKERRGPDYKAEVDEDDFLYYHWYRRWEFISWYTRRPEGPMSSAAVASRSGPGLPLAPGSSFSVNNLTLYTVRTERRSDLAAFPDVRAGSGEDFLLVTLRFQALGTGPRAVDSSEFFLLDNLGARYRNPLISGRAKTAQPENQMLSDSPTPAVMTPRKVRFSFAPNQTQGQFLADGAGFVFATAAQHDVRTLVFLVRKNVGIENLRLNVTPAPPPETKAPPAKSPETKAPPAKAPEPKPAAVKPPPAKPAETKPAPAKPPETAPKTPESKPAAVQPTTPAETKPEGLVALALTNAGGAILRFELRDADNVTRAELRLAPSDHATVNTPAGRYKVLYGTYGNLALLSIEVNLAKAETWTFTYEKPNGPWSRKTE